MIGFPQAGERFGDFLIESDLGRGGMGVVFRATQVGLNRPVALKVLDPALAGDAEFTQRFEREASILASMSSPHVIQVFGHGRIDDCLYLATQYIAGGDLAQLLRRTGALQPTLALDLTGQVLAALADAHALGVIHRDVKPSNILLTSSGDRPFAYLADFGIAQNRESGLTRSGVVAGSWAYLAPERHAGEPAAATSDLYSAGCILWACLTGQAPYQGTDVQMAMAHANAPVPQLPGTDPQTVALNTLLARSLAKEPAHRYPSATAFLNDVQATGQFLLGRSPAPDVDDRPHLRGTLAPPRPLQPRRPQPRRRSTRRRRPRYRSRRPRRPTHRPPRRRPPPRYRRPRATRCPRPTARPPRCPAPTGRAAAAGWSWARSSPASPSSRPSGSSPRRCSTPPVGRPRPPAHGRPTRPQRARPLRPPGTPAGTAARRRNSPGAACRPGSKA
jgi:serine/threonine-protein kinase